MTDQPTVTHIRIHRVETYHGGRIASIDDLREYVPGLDLTDVPAEKIAEHIEHAIFAVDDCGELNEWIDRYNECTDSETTVTPFLHQCGTCGKPLIESQGDWIDPNYGMTCDGSWLFRNPDAQKHAPAVPPAPEPEPAPTRFALDREQAALALALIVDAIEDDDWQQVQEHLPADRLDDAECIGLDGFDPVCESDTAEGSIDALIRTSWGLWLTGPAEPFYSYSPDTDGGSFTFYTDLGNYPASVRVMGKWEEARRLVDRDEKGEPNTGVEAALDVLDALVSELNGVLTELDNYVAARKGA